jgi:Zn-dependent protease
MEHVPKIVLTLLALGISVIFHEQMHARVAYWLGDPTGKNDNRLSWNPIHHIDPFLTIFLPLILYFSSQGRFTFGGAKPVQINPMNFKNPSLGMCLAAAAGPLSNYFLAVVGFGLCTGLYHVFPSSIVADGMLTWNGFFFTTFIFTNVLLGTFNLLPIPPLDGSRVVRHLLPRSLQPVMDFIEPFGFIILMLLVILGATKIITPVLILALAALTLATGTDFYDALMASLFR